MQRASLRTTAFKNSVAPFLAARRGPTPRMFSQLPSVLAWIFARAAAAKLALHKGAGNGAEPFLFCCGGATASWRCKDSLAIGRGTANVRLSRTRKSAVMAAGNTPLATLYNRCYTATAKALYLLASCPGRKAAQPLAACAPRSAQSSTCMFSRKETPTLPPMPKGCCLYHPERKQAPLLDK